MANSEIPLTKPGHTVGTDSIGSALCTQCGLCCRGVIHNNAVLDPDEIPAAQSLGLTVCEAERPVFALPCPRLAGTVCTIYADRPRVCSRYKCQVLQDLEANDKDLGEALALVASAKELLERMRTAMPNTMSLKNAKALVTGVPKAGSDAGLSIEQLMQLRLRVIALELYLDKHFRNAKDGRVLDLVSQDAESVDMAVLGREMDPEKAGERQRG